MMSRLVIRALVGTSYSSASFIPSRYMIFNPRCFLFACPTAPDGNPMSPPELAANRPVTFFAEPIDIAFGIARWNDVYLSVADGIYSHLSKSRVDRLCVRV